MSDDHRYRVTARWTGNRGGGTTGYRDYDRLVTISADGKPDLAASADRSFRGDPQRWNPEDLLLAALSECHLLSYLHSAVTRDVVVVDYVDETTGVMRVVGNGGHFVEVTLHPVVTVANSAMVEAALAAHHDAHEWCFIANSVNFPVRVEPVIVVA